MQLRNQVEWALHCCAILAGLPAGSYLSTRDLATLHGIPKEYLSKALQGLSQDGIVGSTLGPGGGYCLAKAAENITFLDIVEAVEGKGPLFVCAEIRRNNPCRAEGHCDSKPCSIARVMWDADRAWRAKLASVSLADLQKMIADEVDADLLGRTAAWVAARS